MTSHQEFLKRFLRHEADLRAFIGSLVFDVHQRDDVFQEVVLALWQQMDQYESIRSFGAWARGVAANKILQQRGRNDRFPIPLSPESIQAVLDAFDRTEDKASRQAEALRDCVERLSEKSRTLLQLRYELDLSADEIAQRTDGSLHAIYQALSRIRQKLEECIKLKLGLEGGAA